MISRVSVSLNMLQAAGSCACRRQLISFGTKKDGETEKKHDDFVARMVQHGYTKRQVRRLVEWYMRVKQAG